MKKFNFDIEEYKLLRSEITAESNNRMSILSFGIASLSFLFSTTVGLLSNLTQQTVVNVNEMRRQLIDPLPTVYMILVFVVPVICLCIILLWSYSAQKIAKIEFYISSCTDEARPKISYLSKDFLRIEQSRLFSILFLFNAFAIFSCLTGFLLLFIPAAKNINFLMKFGAIIAPLTIIVLGNYFRPRLPNFSRER